MTPDLAFDVICCARAIIRPGDSPRHAGEGLQESSAGMDPFEDMMIMLEQSSLSSAIPVGAPVLILLLGPLRRVGIPASDVLDAFVEFLHELFAAVFPAVLVDLGGDGDLSC